MKSSKIGWIIITIGVLILGFKILELLNIIPLGKFHSVWSWLMSIVLIVNGILILKKEQ